MIDDFLINPDGNEILTRGKTLKLESKTMNLLTLLAENAERTLSKEEIFREIWPDMIVTEDSISRCISQLRKAFSDDPQNPRVIETIPRKGYRIKVPVQFVEQEAGEPVSPERRVAASRRKRISPWLAGFVAGVIAFFLVYGQGYLNMGQGIAIVIASFSLGYVIFHFIDRRP